MLTVASAIHMMPIPNCASSIPTAVQSRFFEEPIRKRKARTEIHGAKKTTKAYPQQQKQWTTQNECLMQSAA